MKTRLHQYALFGLILFSTCAAREAADPTFPEIGKFYVVDFTGASVVDDKTVYYQAGVPNGATVQIIRHSGGTWSLVEYLRPIGIDEKSKKSRFKRDHLWLNFANLLTARELKKEDARTPKDAIVDE